MESSFLSSQNGASIYQGPQHAAGKTTRPALRDAGVTGIVNCTYVFPNVYEQDGIEYCRVSIEDDPGANILVWLDGAAQFINRHISRGGSVLVHCQKGVSRSSSVVIAYLIKYKSLTAHQAYGYIRERRPQVRPNKGFWQQLKIFEARIKKQKRLADLGITDDDEEFKFDLSWAEQSFATFQTIGHLLEDKTECLSEITSRDQIDAKHVLFVATDFIFCRGIQDTDLPWLAAVCAALNQSNAGSGSQEVISEMLTSLLASGSKFSELWGGEIFPNDVERVKSAVLGTAVANPPSPLLNDDNSGSGMCNGDEVPTSPRLSAVRSSSSSSVTSRQSAREIVARRNSKRILIDDDENRNSEHSKVGLHDGACKKDGAKQKEAVDVVAMLSDLAI